MTARIEDPEERIKKDAMRRSYVNRSKKNESQGKIHTKLTIIFEASFSTLFLIIYLVVIVGIFPIHFPFPQRSPQSGFFRPGVRKTRNSLLRYSDDSR